MVLIFLFISIFTPEPLQAAGIFGPDDRLPVNGGSTAVAVLTTLISNSLNKVQIETSPATKFLCKEEKFSNDPSLPYACTGFLVAPDLIATAGHCMVNVGESKHDTDKYCSAYSWLFNYEYDAEGKINTKSIPEDNLYKCKEVIYAINEEHAPFRDFALVLLERPVQNHAPLTMSADKIDPKEVLSLIGYPFGMPAKLSSGGKILLDSPTRQSFITNLSAFEGNSGSPVFNSSHSVVGILTGGTPSINYFKKEGMNCSSYNYCDKDGTNCTKTDLIPQQFEDFQKFGAEVQRIGPLIDLIQEFRNSQPQKTKE